VAREHVVGKLEEETIVVDEEDGACHGGEGLGR
jgi:hypothetical protein